MSSGDYFPIRQLLPRDFPALLKEIPDKPKMLYVRGKMPPKDHKYLCVVGSRATSIYGRRVCQQLIAGLAGYPVVIVSGMALGIDSEAHKAAIYDFPKRNRISAGMSHCALIIEAGEKSGTLITARLALDYNREVLAIPHELGRETGAGVNRLIREGATLVRTADDILQSLGIKPLDTPKQAALPTDLSEAEAKVLHALVEPLVRDELIESSGLSAQEANIALSSLLIRGLITERLGKIERV